MQEKLFDLAVKIVRCGVVCVVTCMVVQKINEIRSSNESE